MQATIYKHPLTILNEYLDSFGHMNYKTYVVLYEDVRWDIINKNGYGMEKIRATNLGPTILEINIRYLRELLAGDEIIVETQLISYEKKIGVIQQKMLRGEQVCSTAEIKLCLFDLANRKIVMPTKDWLESLGVS